MELSSKILSDITIFSKYAKYLPHLNRRETWEEIVDRNKAMHLKKFPQLKDEIETAYKFVHDKKVLPSMRSMQFAGKPIEINPIRLFNCSFIQVSNPYVFAEIMFLLLSGTGVGYSVQSRHIEQLPEITKPTRKKRFLIGDSIEGWADAVKALVDSYMKRKPLPVFDFNDIRAKGEQLITSGGKAPGPDPLRICLAQIQGIFESKQNGEKLKSIEVHDIICHIADCVLSGGIRRAACLALFDFDDYDMLGCKVGNWWELHPQRGRSNNTAVILRNKIKKPEFIKFWERIKLSGSGEPGIMFTNDSEYGANPCFEVSLYSNNRGGQFCNLTSINADAISSESDFFEACRIATFIGTLQASYTNFHYLRDEWKKITDRDALLGVSITGIASMKLEKYNFSIATETIISENKRIAKLIGINPAARLTVLKPEGTASCVCGTSSGIHAWHNDFYIRRMRVGKNEILYKYLKQNHPELLEDEFFKPTEQACISVPQKSPSNAILRTESPIKLLNRVKEYHEKWISPCHIKGANTNNVSVTISIKDHEWDKVGDWLWDNRTSYTGIAVIPYDTGNYVQAPFEDCSEYMYNKMMKTLKDVDLTKIKEMDDSTSQVAELACSGNSCQITSV